MNRSKSFFLGLALLTSTLGLACAVESEEPLNESAGSLAYGEATTDPAYDAVGFIQSPDGKFCSGTLVAPNVIITARHCLNRGCNDAFISGKTFATHGTRATIVSQKILPYAGAPSSGSDCNGSDFAVGVLDRAIPDVTPLKTGQLAPSDVGKILEFVGYGYNEQNVSGSRTKGPSILRAVSGNFWEQTFGSLKGVQAHVKARVGGDYPRFASMIGQYYNTPLVGAFEAFLWAPNQAQTRNGDSGGAILDKVDGKLVIYGTVSGGWSGIDKRLNLGTVVSTVNPQTQALIDEAIVANPSSSAPTAPTGKTCGAAVCGEGERCCNPLEGTCAPPGFFCAL